MSFFSNIVKNVKEFYSEINAATLTGAIDVIVIQSEDGTYRSSPFHVRFGKLGVLKSREKVVDLEINGETVSIQMKLDDNGAAFFVEEVEDQDEDLTPDLATSPIPSSSWEFREIMERKEVRRHSDDSPDGKRKETLNITLVKEEKSDPGREDEGALLNAAREETREDVSRTDPDARKAGKLNKKKRRRRNQLKHSRKGSKTSLKDITAECEQDMFAMDDVNDADQEDQEDAEEEEEDFSQPETASTSIASSVASKIPTSATWSSSMDNWKSIQQTKLSRDLSLEFANSFNMAMESITNSSSSNTDGSTTGNSTPLGLALATSSAINHHNQFSLLQQPASVSATAVEKDPLGSSAPPFPPSGYDEMITIENSLIGSRVPLIPKSSSEAKTLEALLNCKDHSDEELHRPKSVSASFHYFTDTELEMQSTPLHTRPSSPVTSDSEIEKAAREEQSSWKWGELPSPPQIVNQVVEEESSAPRGAPAKLQQDQESSLLSWFSRSKQKLKEEETAEHKGMYLDDLISGEVDPQTAAIYFSPGLIQQTNHQINKSLQDPLAINEEESLDVNTTTTSLDDTASSLLAHNPIKLEAVSIKTEDAEEDPLLTSMGMDIAVGGLKEDDLESGHGPSLPMSPQSGIISDGGSEGPVKRTRNYNSESEDDLPGLVSRHIPDLAISLCGGLGTAKAITPSQFLSGYVTHSDFVSRLREDKDLLNNPNLVVRINEKYTSWSVAAPFVLSLLLYKEPLAPDLASELTKDGLEVNLCLEEKPEACRKKSKTSWFPWFASSNTSSNNTTQVEKELPKVKQDPLDEIKEEKKGDASSVIASSTEESLTSPMLKLELPERSEQQTIPTSPTNKDAEASSSEGEIDGRRCKKTLRLTSEKLQELNLRPGSNEVQFSVTTAFQGTTRCKCHIYLWRHNDKVVISDIDGTITKSDVLGHILPVIGKDWAQSGVADLFTKIKNNGYHIMYLSARAIGQASITKDYLQSVKQGDVCLPDGPLFLNPESLIHAFRKEVIDRNPEEFKIRCLKDIQSLFEGRNPFFAGYGNRPNDAYAYRAVGIPVSRIFTINPAGELRHELTQNFQTSYVHQSQIADMFFPPVGKLGFNPDFKIQEFSDFGFWRDTMPAIDTSDFDEMVKEEV